MWFQYDRQKANNLYFNIQWPCVRANNKSQLCSCYMMFNISILHAAYCNHQVVSDNNNISDGVGWSIN